MNTISPFSPLAAFIQFVIILALIVMGGTYGYIRRSKDYREIFFRNGVLISLLYAAFFSWWWLSFTQVSATDNIALRIVGSMTQGATFTLMGMVSYCLYFIIPMFVGYLIKGGANDPIPAYKPEPKVRTLSHSNEREHNYRNIIVIVLLCISAILIILAVVQG